MENNNNISQDLFETIERYLNGTMDIQELKDFNLLLESSDTLKTQISDVKTTLLGIETQSLKEQLDQFHQEIPKTKTQKPLSKKVRFLTFSKIAAAATIIIAIGSIWFFNSQPNQRLYVKYFKPDPGLPTTMGINEDNFDFYDAMVNYKHGDYTLAISKWSILSHKKPANDTLNYFLGVAHLANKNSDDAIRFLERTVQSKNSFPLINDAHYYLGLAYLKKDNLVLAKKHLLLSHSEAGKELLSKLPK